MIIDYKCNVHYYYGLKLKYISIVDSKVKYIIIVDGMAKYIAIMNKKKSMFLLWIVR